MLKVIFDLKILLIRKLWNANYESPFQMAYIVETNLEHMN